MIQYNPKEWYRFIFKIHEGDTIRKLFPLIIVLALYSGAIVWLEKEYFELSEKSYIKNIPMMHAILGGVISLLLVFRTNSAYDRWWEGRKLWGDLTNNSRNLALKLHHMLPPHDKPHRDFFKKAIPAFAFALKNHLLSGKADWELFHAVAHDSISKRIDRNKHVPLQISNLMYQHLQEAHQAKQLSDTQLWLLNDEVKSFINICGACERIKNTPIPYSYSAFIKKFIFGYVMTLPFGYMFSLGYLSIPIIVFIFYVLASLELIAEEIEDPFGTDSNDLPMLQISHNIQQNIKDIFADTHSSSSPKS